MSRPTYRLALRSALQATPQRSSWICRRCLATQAASSSSNDAAAGLQSLKLEGNTNVASESFNASSSKLQPPPAHWANLTYLSRPLPHRIPPAYLRLCDPQALTPDERDDQKRVPASKMVRGVVVSAGKIDKTVKMRVAGQQWNKKIGKYYDMYTTHLVHDPNSSLIAGDVIDTHPMHTSKTVRHLVAKIVVPFGKNVDERPPIPSPEELLNEYKRRRLAKFERRNARARKASDNAEARNDTREKKEDKSKTK